jgi:hypothetical protein
MSQYGSLPEALPSGSIGEAAIVGGIGVARAGKMAGSGNGNGLKRLADRLARSSKRSPFARYLHANYDRFTQILGEYGARWEEIAQWAQEEGLTGGKPIKATAARRAYDRERQRRAGAASSAPPKVSPERQPAPPARTQEPSPEGQETPDSGISGLFDKADAEQRPWMPRRRTPKKE